MPLEPYLVDSLVGKGVEATATLARLQSFHQVAQLVGCVAFGGFLDRYGCRAGLLVSSVMAAAAEPNSGRSASGSARGCYRGHRASSLCVAHRSDSVPHMFHSCAAHVVL